MIAPHFLPYQGSKRKVADQILSHVPKNIRYQTLYEPFAGSAAFSIYSLTSRPEQFKSLALGESYEPLASIWEMVIKNPSILIEGYRSLWEQQTDCKDFNNEFFLSVRDLFNEEKMPEQLLFLAARCVKSSIRFNADGEFNQSADKRRKGVKPEKMERNIQAVHNLVCSRADVYNTDFMELFELASSEDLVYCDPPWLGVTNSTNKRYFQQLDFDHFVTGLELLNSKNVDFLVSFDGMRGDKDYGGGLPPHLRLRKVYVDGGISSQSVLNGRRERTLESLYISESLCHKIN